MGKTCSEETRKKISDAQKGKPRALHVMNRLREYAKSQKGMLKIWSEDEVRFIKNNLQFSNKKLAGECGKSISQLKNMMWKQNIKRSPELARSVQISQIKGKKLTVQTRMKISAANKGKIKSPETCLKLSIAKKGVKFSEEHKKKLRARRGAPNWSEEGLRRIQQGRLGNKSRKGQKQSYEERMKHSRAMAECHASKRFPIIDSHIEYGGAWMKSSWEVAFAKWCDLNNLKWKYEPKFFETKYGSYLPDFYLTVKDLYVEIKGQLKETSARKMSEFVRMGYDLAFVDNPNNIDLDRRWCL